MNSTPHSASLICLTPQPSRGTANPEAETIGRQDEDNCPVDALKTRVERRRHPRSGAVGLLEDITYGVLRGHALIGEAV